MNFENKKSKRVLDTKYWNFSGYIGRNGARLVFKASWKDKDDIGDIPALEFLIDYLIIHSSDSSYFNLVFHFHLSYSKRL